MGDIIRMRRGATEETLRTLAELLEEAADNAPKASTMLDVVAENYGRLLACRERGMTWKAIADLMAKGGTEIAEVTLRTRMYRISQMVPFIDGGVASVSAKSVRLARTRYLAAARAEKAQVHQAVVSHLPVRNLDAQPVRAPEPVVSASSIDKPEPTAAVTMPVSKDLETGIAKDTRPRPSVVAPKAETAAEAAIRIIAEQKAAREPTFDDMKTDEERQAFVQETIRLLRDPQLVNKGWKQDLLCMKRRCWPFGRVLQDNYGKRYPAPAEPRPLPLHMKEIFDSEGYVYTEPTREFPNGRLSWTSDLYEKGEYGVRVNYTATYALDGEFMPMDQKPPDNFGDLTSEDRMRNHMRSRIVSRLKDRKKAG